MEVEYKIVKKEWIEKIKKTNFKTRDDSILYNYLISPLCNLLLKLVPKFLLKIVQMLSLFLG